MAVLDRYSVLEVREETLPQTRVYVRPELPGVEGLDLEFRIDLQKGRCHHATGEYGNIKCRPCDPQRTPRTIERI